MHWWVIWLIAAIVLAVAEVLTTTLALGLVAAAAGVTAISAALGLPLPVQVAVFAAASAAGLGLVWPVARRHVRQAPLLRTGADALVGKRGLVLSSLLSPFFLFLLFFSCFSSLPYASALCLPSGPTFCFLPLSFAPCLVYPRE